MITYNPNNETLFIEDTPYTKMVHAFIDGRHRRKDSDVIVGSPFVQTVIPVADEAHCEHSYTICNDCVSEWKIDYDFYEEKVN